MLLDDAELMLNVLRCQLTCLGQVVTNGEARFNKSLRPRKPEGSLGRTAQDVHLDSHTAPELCWCFFGPVSLLRRRERAMQFKFNAALLSSESETMITKDYITDGEKSPRRPPSTFTQSSCFRSVFFLKCFSTSAETSEDYRGLGAQDGRPRPSHSS